MAKSNPAKAPAKDNPAKAPAKDNPAKVSAKASTPPPVSDNWKTLAEDHTPDGTHTVVRGMDVLVGTLVLVTCATNNNVMSATSHTVPGVRMRVGDGGMYYLDQW